MIKLKAQKNQKSKLFLFIKTQILILILLIIIILIASAVIYSADEIGSKYYFYIITAIISLIDFISGHYIGSKIKKNGMLNALLYCLPINLIIFAVSMILNLFNIDLTLLFSAIIIISANMLGGIVSVNNKSKVKRAGR